MGALGGAAGAAAAPALAAALCSGAAGHGAGVDGGKGTALPSLLSTLLWCLMPLSSYLHYLEEYWQSAIFLSPYRRVHFPFLPAVRGLQRGQRDPPAQDGSCARPGEDERPTRLEQTAFDLRNAELGQRTVRAAHASCCCGGGGGKQYISSPAWPVYRIY